MAENERVPQSRQPERVSDGGIDEYIARFSPEIRGILEEVRALIRREAPEASERIRYGMPTFHQEENLIHFAAMKHHLGIYPGPEAVEAFAPRLGEYKTSKGAIQFPFSKPIPFDLIVELTRFRVQMVLRKKHRKENGR